MRTCQRAFMEEEEEVGGGGGGMGIGGFLASQPKCLVRHFSRGQLGSSRSFFYQREWS